MATYDLPSRGQIDDYARALNNVPGGRQTSLAPQTSNLGAPVARGGLKGLRQWLGITILGADGARVLFPPQQPLQPIAQSPDQAGIGRPWDYPVGYNTRVTPRDAQISFATLKNLAVGYDVLAIMIGRVKDKIVSQQWSIGPKDQKQQKQFANDARIGELTDFLEYPDKDHSFDDWSRMLLDQVIMYDAPAIWLQMDRGNRLYALQILDGALITPKIGADGRIPTPDMGPAYQQVLHGLPAVDYIKPMRVGMPPPVNPEDGFPFPELLYKPRNPRVDSLYGFGPVEQIITTVNIALRREAFLLQYYTDGSTPDLLLTVPPTWNPDQIKNFQLWWDSVLAGNLAGRRGAKFIPDGVKAIDTKEKALTDETDQWLIRIMCFSLGLNPMPFIKQMNRGQEKTHHDEAAQEGLEPWLEWFANLINTVIALKFGYTDIVFRWKEDESTDEATRATIATAYVNAKIYHPDEIREKLGDEPMAPDLRDQMDMATFSQTANATILPDDQQAAKDDAAKELAASKPAPMMPVAPKPAAKAAEPVVNHFRFEMPAINVQTAPAPAINISAPPVTVNMPEIHQPDVFVDVGATNVHAKFEQPKKTNGTGERTITYERDKDGGLVAKVTESTTRTVRGIAKAD